jgi:hypothetical protein
MSEIHRLQGQLRAALEGGAWHGPAVLELLAGVTAEQALARPIPAAHTIWELTLHLQGTYDLVLRRLRGDPTPFTDEDDWPAIPAIPTTAAWHAALSQLRRLSLMVREEVGKLDPARLDLPLGDPLRASAYAQLIGLTQHDLYHAGQIAILMKAIAPSSKPGAMEVSQ